MENFGKLCCALCHGAIRNRNSKKIDLTKKAILRVILLKLNFDAVSKQVICEICLPRVMEAFKFKSMCVNTNNTIISYVDELGCPVDLIKIYAKEKEFDPLINVLEECKVCRFCMQLIETELISVHDLNVDMIESYIPEINFSIFEDPVICRHCFDSFSTHSSFIKKCLEIEEKSKSLLISCIKTEEIEIKPEVNDHEVNLRQSEFTVMKSEDENVSVKTDSIVIKTEENNESGVFQSDEGLDDRMNEHFADNVRMEEHVHELEMYNRDLYDFSTKDQCNFDRHVTTPSNEYGLQGDEFKLKGLSVKNKSGRNYKVKQTKDKSNIVKRQLIHKGLSEVQMHECEICGFRTKYKRYFVRHQLKHKDPTEVQMYECDICDFRTKYKESFVRHQLIHKNPSEVQIYECNTCNHKTINKSNLVSHQLIHKDSSEVHMYECDICDFRTKYKDCFVRHQLMHKDSSEVHMYECDICDFRSKYRESFVRHRKLHNNPSEVQMYECDVCDFRTKHKVSFTRHQLIHKDSSEVEMYECDTCDYRSKYKQYLVKHQLLHKDPSQMQMYECGICDYRSKYKQYLVKHQLRHKDPSEVQMYDCDICDYRSKYKHCLVNHQLKHKDPSEVQTYECDTSDKKT